MQDEISVIDISVLIEGGPPSNVFSDVSRFLLVYNLDLEPMTLTYELDLDILKM